MTPPSTVNRSCAVRSPMRPNPVPARPAAASPLAMPARPTWAYSPAQHEAVEREGRRHREGGGGRTRPVEQARGAGPARAGLLLVFRPAREGEMVGEGVARQDGAPVGRGALGDAEPLVAADIGELKVGRDDPGTVRVGIDEVEDARIVLQQRRGVGVHAGAADVSTRVEGDGLRVVELVGDEPGDPIEPPGKEAVGPRRRHGPGAFGIVDLDALVDGVLLGRTAGPG